MADTTDTAQKPAVPSTTPSTAKASDESEVRDGRLIPAKQESDGPPGFDANPHGNYDLMSVEQLRDEAKEMGVWIPRDVEKAHLITSLRAGITSTR